MCGVLVECWWSLWTTLHTPQSFCTSGFQKIGWSGDVFCDFCPFSLIFSKNTTHWSAIYIINTAVYAAGLGYPVTGSACLMKIYVIHYQSFIRKIAPVHKFVVHKLVYFVFFILDATLHPNLSERLSTEGGTGVECCFKTSPRLHQHSPKTSPFLSSLTNP